jgi:hypothetical protein
MQEVVLRDFIRNYKSYLPLPREGIKLLYNNGDDFYVCPNKPETEVDKLRKIAQFLAQEMRESQQWETVEPLASPAQPTTIVVAPPVHQCEAKLLLPWETACKNSAEKFLVANTQDGEPMNESDWKPVYLCAIHKRVVESIGGFEIETE